MWVLTLELERNSVRCKIDGQVRLVLEIRQTHTTCMLTTKISSIDRSERLLGKVLKDYNLSAGRQRECGKAHEEAEEEGPRPRS